MLKIFILAACLWAASPLPAQIIRQKKATAATSFNREIARPFFGRYEFSPQFQITVFSVNQKLFAQRIGDPDRFQLLQKSPAVFSLQGMPAELQFKKSLQGSYDSLVLSQGGKLMKGHRTYAQPFELYDTILHLDSLLYAAYNGRDAQALMAYFSPELEFYHDLTGKTGFEENRQVFETNFSKPTRMRRSLLKGSLEIYPIKDFGAVEIGTHQFFQIEKGQAEKLVAQPKFVHIWKKTADNWQIVKVISYDH